MEFFADIFNWIAALPPHWIYVTIFFVAYLENVLPPIPGDMIVVFGGYLVGRDILNFPLSVLLTSLGGVLGFMSMYAFGFRIRKTLDDPERYKWVSRSLIAKAQQWLLVYGYSVIAFNRFLAGTRSVISITVGMSHMPVGRVTFWATVSSAVWCGLLTFFGYWVGDHWSRIDEYLQIYGRTIFSLTALIVVIIVFRRLYLKNNNKSTETGS